VSVSFSAGPNAGGDDVALSRELFHIEAIVSAATPELSSALLSQSGPTATDSLSFEERNRSPSDCERFPDTPESSGGADSKLAIGVDLRPVERMPMLRNFDTAFSARLNPAERTAEKNVAAGEKVEPLNEQVVLWRTIDNTYRSAQSADTESARETEFEASLPVRVELPALSTAPIAAQVPRCRRRVLIVEDNPDSAASLCILLELMGHEVRVAYTGPEAVAVASEWPPEITISDIGLPGFDGFEVARRLRGKFGNRPLLVALTGYGRDEDRRRSHEAGFDHHLVKPADPDEIQRMLATAR
jgi:CheY-like chemotaxis protein